MLRWCCYWWMYEGYKRFDTSTSKIHNQRLTELKPSPCGASSRKGREASFILVSSGTSRNSLSTGMEFQLTGTLERNRKSIDSLQLWHKNTHHSEQTHTYRKRIAQIFIQAVKWFTLLVHLVSHSRIRHIPFQIFSNNTSLVNEGWDREVPESHRQSGLAGNDESKQYGALIESGSCSEAGSEYNPSCVRCRHY